MPLSGHLAPLDANIHAFMFPRALPIGAMIDAKINKILFLPASDMVDPPDKGEATMAPPGTIVRVGGSATSGLQRKTIIKKKRKKNHDHDKKLEKKVEKDANRMKVV
ncbi:hypothetical protein HZ326_8682 [Fusarium oxysporum f. sp. albedinis]|nr:hypothetical protein HZ326_8682 [Fusarium oxysporum f. sp. albedinis]